LVSSVGMFAPGRSGSDARGGGLARWCRVSTRLRQGARARTRTVEVWRVGVAFRHVRARALGPGRARWRSGALVSRFDAFAPGRSGPDAHGGGLARSCRLSTHSRHATSRHAPSDLPRPVGSPPTPLYPRCRRSQAAAPTSAPRCRRSQAPAPAHISRHRPRSRCDIRHVYRRCRGDRCSSPMTIRRSSGWRLPGAKVGGSAERPARSSPRSSAVRGALRFPPPETGRPMTFKGSSRETGTLRTGRGERHLPGSSRGRGGSSGLRRRR
jgi:hypothetical protein